MFGSEDIFGGVGGGEAAGGEDEGWFGEGGVLYL